MIFYHATASLNVDSILRNGLKVDQRGVNPYGLDKDVDYDEIYENADDAAANQKSPAIHFSRDLEAIQFYKEMIENSFQVEAVVLEVDIDPAIYTLKADHEDSAAFYCETDVNAQYITICQQISPTNVYSDSENEDEESETEEVNNAFQGHLSDTDDNLQDNVDPDTSDAEDNSTYQSDESDDESSYYTRENRAVLFNNKRRPVDTQQETLEQPPRKKLNRKFSQ